MDNLFLLSGNGYMVNKNYRKLKDKLGIQLEELNVNVFLDMPSVDELIDVCSSVPLMSDKRLVVLKDAQVLNPKAGKEETSRTAGYLESIPDTTVLVLCYEGAPDKRRTLYKSIKKQGTVYEYPEPKQADCINFAMMTAKENGGTLKKAAAAQLVDIVGLDYFSLENEINKLLAYTSAGEILPKHIKECTSKSLEYNVFEMHSYMVKGSADKAMKLLDEILSDGRPEALIGLIAYNFREMYKVRSMLDLSYPASKMASTLKLPDFILRKRIDDCKRYTGEDIRNGIKLLGELDFLVKSGRSDAFLMLPQTLLKIYKLQ